ncbi:MAG: antibiotic biosynthesis monooxygenase [Candidatus Riflebacteria bacterium]|nr:antibiotic biosynthesis monooxygenase [Candidatus Riflebacteria bacterium]
MITVGMNYKVREGKEQVFEDAFHSLTASLQGMPGHIATQLFRDLDSPRTYLILSEWGDKQSFDGFVGSERWARIAHWGRQEILEERPTHEIFER